MTIHTSGREHSYTRNQPSRAAPAPQRWAALSAELCATLAADGKEGEAGARAWQPCQPTTGGTTGSCRMRPERTDASRPPELGQLADRAAPAPAPPRRPRLGGVLEVADADGAREHGHAAHAALGHLLSTPLLESVQVLCRQGRLWLGAPHASRMGDRQQTLPLQRRRPCAQVGEHSSTAGTGNARARSFERSGESGSGQRSPFRSRGGARGRLSALVPAHPAGPPP